MANHYITLDEQNRIIDGFSDSFKYPATGDILIRENAGDAFELFGKDPGRPLSFLSQGKEVWKYKWTGSAIEQRSTTEIAADLSPLPDVPTVEEQVAANTYDIETLNMAIQILLGTEGAE